MNLTIRGLSYHIAVHGDWTREPAVVLLHGFGGSSEDWETLIPSVRAAGLAVLAPDLIGHGRTAAPEDPSRYALDEAALDLEAMLRELNVDRAHWLGYSMGGRLALRFALQHPGRVASLTLESASAGIGDSGARLRRRASDDALANRIEERGIEWFADYWSAVPLFETQRELPAATRAALHARRLRNSAAGLARSLRGMGQGVQDYLGGRLASIACKALLIAGERDPKYVEVSRRLAEAIPRSICRIIPAVGHTVHLEAPEAFARILVLHWITVEEPAAGASSPS